MSDDPFLNDELHVIRVPLGRWIKRVDERSGNVPFMAYGMESSVLLIWTDGSYTTKPADSVFPASNWKVWDIE